MLQDKYLNYYAPKVGEWQAWMPLPDCWEYGSGGEILGNNSTINVLLLCWAVQLSSGNQAPNPQAPNPGRS